MREVREGRKEELRRAGGIEEGRKEGRKEGWKEEREKEKYRC